MSGGGSSGGGNDWGSLLHGFSNFMSSGGASNGPFQGRPQPTQNAPWNGMTFQQSMGLYPAGTFPGYAPPQQQNPNPNPMKFGNGQPWAPAVTQNLTGAPALGNAVFPNAAGAMPWSGGGMAGSQPFQAPADYSGFANLATGSGTPAAAPTPPPTAPGVPATNTVDYSNMPAGNQ